MADGMSFRGCLSGGGDIFSKSVEKQGGANRTFATGGRCHGWQLEPCPCGLEPLLTFRQKIPTGRPYIEEGHSVRHGRSWICFTNFQFTLQKQYSPSPMVRNTAVQYRMQDKPLPDLHAVLRQHLLLHHSHSIR